MTERMSEHIAWAKVKVTQDGADLMMNVTGIPYTWKWDEETRDVAEYAAVLDWLSESLDFDWVSILAWGSTSAIKGKDNG